MRAEALWGLALRKDRVGLTLLLQRLESGSWASRDELAAQETLGADGNTPATEICWRDIPVRAPSE